MLDSKTFKQISEKVLQLALKNIILGKYLSFYTDFQVLFYVQNHCGHHHCTAHCATLLLQNRIVVKPEVSREKVVHWLGWTGS